MIYWCVVCRRWLLLCLWYIEKWCLAISMTSVNSAAKMVGHLRRWLTGEEVTADSPCVENVSARCSTCTCNSVASSQFVYRGRSYSDCCSTSCQSGYQDQEARERSCSVSSRWTTSQDWRKLGLHTYHTSSRSAWSSDRQSSVHALLEEDRELCRCCEPVCCCERCFVYVNDHPPLLPPPYGELLLGGGTDVAAKLINSEPSVTADTADVTDQVTIVAAADDSRTSLSTKPVPSATGQLDDTVSALF